MPLNVLKVWYPQTIDAVLVGPGPANRLFIFTGIIEIDWPAPRDNILAHDVLELNLSDWHGDIHFDSNVTQLASVAWPASMHADDDADQVTWAVDTAHTFVSAANRPTLHMDLAVQGDKGMLGRIAYQVFARTTSIPIKSFDVVQSPWRPVLEATVVLSQVALGNGEDIYLSGGQAGAKLPAKLTIPGGTDTGVVVAPLDLSQFPQGNTQIEFTARNAVSELKALTIIHKG